ncbi:hypothetical protein [Burkholderia sp. WAC0059]|uniref:hypothetical protein n=1 Tax=Burkholderia sp. WAC0059 TaxID=2066022 RepID=UPI0011AF4C55|nr:hypothetical protein [Burkholderia sp. WAC0059]
MNRAAPAFAVFVVLSAAAHAATQDDPLASANNDFSYGLGFGTLSYSEFSPGGGRLDSESAVMPAMQLGATRQGPVFGLPSIYTSVGLTFTGGRESYTGSNLATGEPLRQSEGTAEIDGQIRVGRAFRPAARWQLVPYLTYGVHSWLRGGYETYLNQYAGLGLLTQYEITPKLVGGIDAMLGHTFDPQVMTRGDSSIGTEYLGSNWTRSVGATLDYAYDRRLHFTASYRFTSFSYGMSAPKSGTYEGIYSAGWYEPSSHTHENLVILGATYSF